MATWLETELTKNDRLLLKTLKTLCGLDGKEQFSADDFRMYGLDRFIRDKAHGIGGLFAKWKHHKLIREVGHVRSKLETNHMREIRTYVFSE